jgi:hypothetical protein
MFAQSQCRFGKLSSLVMNCLGDSCINGWQSGGRVTTVTILAAAGHVDQRSKQAVREAAMQPV